MNALTDALVTAAADLPRDVDTDLRRRYQACLTGAADSPVTREHWKYSRIQEYGALLNASPGMPGPEAVPESAMPATSEERTRIHERLVEIARNPRYPLVAVLATTAPLLRFVVPAGDTQRIDLTLAPPNAVLYVEVGKGATADITETREGSEDASSRVLIIDAGAAASIRHELLDWRCDLVDWRLTHVTLADGASYTAQVHTRGARARRWETQLDLEGNDTRAALDGTFVGTRDTRLDQQIAIDHIGRGGHSAQRFHGIATEGSRAAFNGRIHIHPGAARTDAHLTNRNIALHANAEINTKPELEIYNDDVSCSHGATVGRLDEDQMFLCRTRGIPEHDARLMLCRAFLLQCASDDARDWLNPRIAELLE